MNQLNIMINDEESGDSLKPVNVSKEFTFGGYRFFVHRPSSADKGSRNFMVTERSSGMAASGYAWRPTIQDAIEHSQRLLRAHKHDLAGLIASSIRKHGIAND